MSVLRLGAYKLPAAEVALVQTLFRLYAHGDSFRWSFVTAPPYDALLVDGKISESEGPEIDRLARSVLRLTSANSDASANTMGRPIRADRLQEWLKSVESGLLETRPMTGIMPDAARPLLAKAHAEESRAPAVSPVRFKLRRWPPATLLRGDPHRIRMATLLSRQALGAAELATVSQRPAAECQAFLQTLQNTGLVDVHTDPSATASASTRSSSRPSKG